MQNPVSILLKPSLSQEESRGAFQMRVGFHNDYHKLVLNQDIRRDELAAILYDTEIAQCVDTLLSALLNVSWAIKDTKGTKKQRDFLTLQLSRHYRELIVNSFNSFLYGYDVMERVYEDTADGIVVKHLLQRPFRWYKVNYKGEIFSDGIQNGRTPLDTKFKYLLTRNKPTYDNPYGDSMLANLFDTWFYRNATWRFWMIFLERAGSPVIYGEGAEPEKIVRQLLQAGQDGAIGVSTGTKIGVLSTTNRGEGFELAEDRLVRTIQKRLLGQTLTSDGGKGGNGGRALGSVHNDVKFDRVVAVLGLCTETIKNYLSALSQLNFPASEVPDFEHDLDLGLEAERAQRDLTLLNGKGLKFTKTYYKRHYRLAEDEFEIVETNDSVSPETVVNDDPITTNANNPEGVN